MDPFHMELFHLNPKIQVDKQSEVNGVHLVSGVADTWINTVASTQSKDPSTWQLGDIKPSIALAWSLLIRYILYWILFKNIALVDNVIHDITLFLTFTLISNKNRFIRVK